jgi:multiple sugar transport system ATP-binding protein
MKDGSVQQFGTPQDIYERPANLYVASFMGSPSMSLLPATLRSVSGRLVTQFQAANGPPCDIDLGPSGNASMDGRLVTLGLRAEHFSAVPSATAGAFQIRIDLLEPTGADTFAYTEINNTRVAVRLPPKPVRTVGDTCWVTLDTAALCLFDPDTGLRLTH